MTIRVLCLRALVFGLLCVTVTARAAELPSFERQIQPLLEKYCIRCHGPDEEKGDLRLDELSRSFDRPATAKWRQVADRVELNQMPPKNKPRPSADERRLLASWVDGESGRAELARRAKEGRVVVRRLNRIEYQNTVRDLLGIQVNLLDQLPEDGSANGFDNAGAALHTSSFLMERYLEAAETALDVAISNRPKPPAMTKLHEGPRDPRQGKQENVFRMQGETLIAFCSSPWHSISPKLYTQEEGDYRFRISASAVQSAGKPVTFRVTHGRTRLTGKSGVVGYFDAPPDEPRVFEFVQHLEKQTSISLLPYGLPGSREVNAIGVDKYEGPGLAIQWIEAEGPLNDIWPPESHRRLFGDLKRKPAPGFNASTRVEVDSDQPLVDAQRILRDFTRRAFRRAVSDTDVEPFVTVVKNKLAADYSFELAMRAALKGVLMSPEFLFLHETPGRLDDFALASRLSYFLWSNPPDDELLQLAAGGKLGTPEELRRQAERMLHAPKAANLTENFVGQWLGLREIDATEPSNRLYPEFDHPLKVAMIREAELFFDEVLKHDLSVANFAASDFSMLNGRLAQHYGIPGVDGWEFQKVKLPPESHRGGVLTMAAVLKVTANGTTTSPVVRGNWVLDRLLGAPAPPPPKDVPAIDPDIRGATTIREQLAKHRADAACAVCHTKIDPPGFALESFDCIGGWRDNYRVTGNGKAVVIDGRRMQYGEGKAVDPSDVMEDGRAFKNVDEFKQLLLSDKDRLARALAAKLTTYATGAAPMPVDGAALNAMVAKVRDKDYGLRSLIHEVVQSDLFRNK
jgi:mono/diheme cytochrome c family protein